jgi:cytosine/adenosine deaminase-related metal-dependent hydrolase
MWNAGVNVALGMDGSTLNDDDDMLQEMRLCLRLHRPVGLGRNYLSANQVFAMATTNAAQASLFGNEIGQLAVGSRADLNLVKIGGIGKENIFERLGVVEALLARGKAVDIDTVMIDGQIVLHNGRLIGIDKQALLEELIGQVGQTRSPEEKERAQLISAMEESMLAFYDDWVLDQYDPYYLVNSRI